MLNCTGKLKVEIFDSEGNLKNTKEYKNLVVQTGKNYAAIKFAGKTVESISHMALGSGTAIPANTDTTLGNELGRSAITSISVNANTVKMIASFAEGVATGEIREAGLFNNANPKNGIMISHAQIDIITKNADDTITITWEITLN